MQAFWNALTLVQKIFYFIAVPATAVLLMQTILTIIGIGNGAFDDADVDFDGAADAETDFDGIDLDADGDGDFDPDPDVDEFHASGFKLFTIKGIVAFFAIFGWTGIVILAKGGSTLLASLVAFLAGTAALIGVAAVLYTFSKMQSDGTLNVKNAIGKTGTVYIPILPDRKPGGKVQIVLQDELRDLPAITDANTTIPTGTAVEVVAIGDNDALVVMPRTANEIAGSAAK